MSCGQEKEPDSEILSSKMVVSVYESNQSFIVEDGKVTSRFDDSELGVLTWFNREDFFFTSRFYSNPNTGKKSDIVKVDTLGNILSILYKAKNEEIAWPLYTSKDDKYLLFTTHYLADPDSFPFEGLTPMLNLKVLALDSTEVILEIDSIGRSPNFKVEESPWLYNDYKFVYSLGNGTKFMEENGDEINPVTKTKGVYIYDLKSKEHKLLIKDGYEAIASPDSNLIAFETANSIQILNLDTDEIKSIYEYSSNVKIYGKHWTPDGQYIYFAYKNVLGVGNTFTTGEKLINIRTGEEKEFKGVKHGFNSYSWK